VVAGGCSFAPSTTMEHAGSYSGRAVVDGNSVSDYAVVRKTLSSFRRFLRWLTFLCLSAAVW